jgi:hypothetical protein
MRLKALKVLRDLTAKIESPMDTIIRIIWLQPTFLLALKIALHLHVFDILGDGEFHSVTEIAKTSQAEPFLIRRILRHLAALGALRENESDSYGSTTLTDGLREKTVHGPWEWAFDVEAPTFARLPEFLAKTGYKDPSDVSALTLVEGK